MPLSETPNQQALRELDETICPVCKMAKASKQSFCRPCYFILSVAMRNSLYKRFGSGYEEAYFEAKEFLIAERKVS